MTAAVTEHAGSSLQERLTAVLAALDYGICPQERCPDCLLRADEWCAACAQARADSALVATAIEEIDAPGTTQERALAVYAKTFIMLTGMAPGQFAEVLSGGAG
jgi:hypothetical protein